MLFSKEFHQKRRHRVRMRRLDRSKGRLKPRNITFSLIVAFIITVAFYAMIAWSWWQAPICMFIGWIFDALQKQARKEMNNE